MGIPHTWSRNGELIVDTNDLLRSKEFQAQVATAAKYADWYKGERRQNWRTPRELFNELHARYRFILDGASEPGNGLLPLASTAEAPIPWTGHRVFCNPPWSDIAPFLELATSAELVVFLVPARTNARWFHRALELGAKPEFFKPRPKFVGAKSGSPVDCVYLVFGSGGSSHESSDL